MDKMLGICLKGSDAKPEKIEAIEGVPVKINAKAFVKLLIVTPKLSMNESHLPKGFILPTHVHEHDSIGYIVKGKAKKTIAGKEYIVEAGDVHYNPAGEPHSTEALEDYVEVEVKTPPTITWKKKPGPI